jgi:hypothetical protein
LNEHIDCAAWGGKTTGTCQNLNHVVPAGCAALVIAAARWAIASEQVRCPSPDGDAVSGSDQERDTVSGSGSDQGSDAGQGRDADQGPDAGTGTGKVYKAVDAASWHEYARTPVNREEFREMMKKSLAEPLYAVPSVQLQPPSDAFRRMVEEAAQTKASDLLRLNPSMSDEDAQAIAKGLADLTPEKVKVVPPAAPSDPYIRFDGIDDDLLVMRAKDLVHAQRLNMMMPSDAHRANLRHARMQLLDAAGQTGPSAAPLAVSRETLKAAVNRFLGWRLPHNFQPDCGISFTPVDHPNSWPTGTNLLSAEQAKEMFEYALKPVEAPPRTDGLEALVRELEDVRLGIVPGGVAEEVRKKIERLTERLRREINNLKA